VRRGGATPSHSLLAPFHLLNIQVLSPTGAWLWGACDADPAAPAAGACDADPAAPAFFAFLRGVALFAPGLLTWGLFVSDLVVAESCSGHCVGRLNPQVQHQQVVHMLANGWVR
jgi:hypothetical protein